MLGQTRNEAAAAEVDFEKLGAAAGTPVKSLMRMLGPSGNPTAANLFEVAGFVEAGRKAAAIPFRA